MKTSRAASKLIRKIISPTTTSGQNDSVAAVTIPAAMIAILATASFLAERYAALGRLLVCFLNAVKINAHETFTTNAPAPVKPSDKASGGIGFPNFSQVIQIVATPGVSSKKAKSIPTIDRLYALQPRATRMRKLIEVSSRKSMESANKETDPMLNATENSTPK